MAMTGVSPQSEALASGLASDLLVSLRPDQWTKNLVVFAGLVFGEQLLDPGAVARSGGTFVIFCALSSAMYLVNDLRDHSRDRLHPGKAARPIADGRVPATVAFGLAGLLLVGGVSGAFLLGPRLGVVALSFAGLLSLYTLVLQEIAILDVLTIATGFVLRAVGGTHGPDQPMALGVHTPTCTLPRFDETTPGGGCVGGLCHEAPTCPWTLQHRGPRPDGNDRGRRDPGKLRGVHDERRNSGEFWDRPANLDDTFSCLRRPSISHARSSR